MTKKIKKNAKGKKAAFQNPIYSGKPFVSFGENLVVVTGSDVQSTAARDGKIVVLEMTVIGGPQNERRHFESFIVEHRNELIANLGRSNLNKFLIAAGFLNDVSLEDTDQLHGMLAVMSVKSRDYVGGLMVTFKKPSKFIRNTIQTSNKYPWKKGTQK